MAKSNVTTTPTASEVEEPLFFFTLSEGNLTKSTSKRITEKVKKELTAEIRKEYEIAEDAQYLEGMGDQFGFSIPSSKAGIKNAALGSFSKKLLAMAGKMDLSELNKLAGCRLVVRVEVFPAPEKTEEKAVVIENNEF